MSPQISFAEALTIVTREIRLRRRSEKTEKPEDAEARAAFLLELPWRCTHCGGVFFSEDEFNEHLEQIQKVAPDAPVRRQESILLEQCRTFLKELSYGADCICGGRNSLHTAACSAQRRIARVSSELVTSISKILA